MSYIKTVPLEEATGEVREMYERQQEAWGYVPNYAKSFSHRTEVMARWGKLLAELQRPMDKRRLEMITFAAAHALKHTSCSLAHGNALTPFFSNEEIRALAEQSPLESVTAAEQEMMRFARQVARDASTVDASDVERHDGPWVLRRRSVRYCGRCCRASVLYEGSGCSRVFAGCRIHVARRGSEGSADRRWAHIHRGRRGHDLANGRANPGPNARYPRPPTVDQQWHETEQEPAYVNVAV